MCLLSPQGGVLYFGVAAAVCGLASQCRGGEDGTGNGSAPALQPEKVTQFFNKKEVGQVLTK